MQVNINYVTQTATVNLGLNKCLMVWQIHSHTMTPGDFHSLKGRLKRLQNPGSGLLMNSSNNKYITSNPQPVKLPSHPEIIPIFTKDIAYEAKNWALLFWITHYLKLAFYSLQQICRTVINLMNNHKLLNYLSFCLLLKNVKIKMYKL